MSAPPTYRPEVDSNGSNLPSDPAGIPAGIKSDGFQEKENIPNTWFNWLFKTINDWIGWAQTTFGVQHDTTTGAHTVVTALSVTTTLDVTVGRDLNVTDDADITGTLDVGENAVVDGVLATKRGVVGGTPLLVGGVAANEGEQSAVGASSTAEHEPVYYDIPADTLRPGTIVRVTSHWTVFRAVSDYVTFATRIGDTTDVVGDRVLASAHLRTAGIGTSRYQIRDEFRVTDDAILGVASLKFHGMSVLSGWEVSAGVTDVAPAVLTAGGPDGEDVLRLSPTVTFAASNAGNEATLDYFTVEILGN